MPRRVIPHGKYLVHVVVCGIAGVEWVAGWAPHHCSLQNHDVIMRNIFSRNAVPKIGNSTNHQTPLAVSNVNAEKRPGGSPRLTWYHSSAPSGLSPVRGKDESTLMRSQLL